MRLFPNRISKPSPRWALWRWFDIILDDELYLSRLNIIQTPWFSIKLHWIHRADPDRDLHDHPWPFMSFVLRGGYDEIESKNPSQEPGKRHRVNWFNFKNTKTAHRIANIDSGTVTLIIAGPRNSKKRWGFYDADTFEYVDWKVYEERKING